MWCNDWNVNSISDVGVASSEKNVKHMHQIKHIHFHTDATDISHATYIRMQYAMR